MSNFINAVIHERAFDKLAKYIDNAKTDQEVEIIAGGTYDKSKGYFVAPTVMVTQNPKYITMCEELFGPIVTIYVYEDNAYAETLQLIDETSDYALTGAIFATDRYAIAEATEALRDNVGNLYINDKCTGAVIGHQPFGGTRASGTNDKAGSAQNLLRWVSPRLIKETFVTPEDYIAIRFWVSSPFLKKILFYKLKTKAVNLATVFIENYFLCCNIFQLS